MKKTHKRLTLLEWLSVWGRTASLSRQLGVSESMVSMWGSGRRRVTAERCLEIERVTKGQVRCETMRPDLHWKRGGV